MTHLDPCSHLDCDECNFVSQSTEHLQQVEDFISEETNNVFCLINYFILSALIGLFGIFTNIIDMIVFYRQGFNTATNITFFALAISDMLSLVTAECVAVFFSPFLEKADVHFVPREALHVSGGWLHVCSSRITSWITVFITAERCLGITLPLKVKQVITLRRTTLTMCLIFVVNLVTLVPEYIIQYLDWKFVPAKNRSLVGLVYRSNVEKAYGLTYTFTSVSGIMSYFCLILLTTFLVIRLAQKSKWRKKVTGGTDPSFSSRDKKTITMVAMIAIVLIVCHIPGTAISLGSTFVPEFMIGRTFSNSYLMFWSIAFVFDTINSSVNVFLYYRMSSKYRQTFNELFSRCIRINRQQTIVASVGQK